MGKIRLYRPHFKSKIDLSQIDTIQEYVRELGKTSIFQLSRQELIDWVIVGRKKGWPTYETLTIVLDREWRYMFERGYKKQCFSLLRQALEEGKELGLGFCDNEDCGLCEPRPAHFEFFLYADEPSFHDENMYNLTIAKTSKH